MAETPEKKKTTTVAEKDEGWLEYMPVPTMTTPIPQEQALVPKELPKTEDTDTSSFADYEDTPAYNNKQNKPLPNAHIVRKFKQYDLMMVLEQGRMMDKSGVRDMVNTTGPASISTGLTVEQEKVRQIGF